MRKTVRNYLRRVLEIIWKGGECLGHGNIIYWVLYLDGFWWAGPSSSQPELPGSKRSFIRSIACVTSPSLIGSHTDQTGLVSGLQLSDRTVASAAIQHKGGDSLHPVLITANRRCWDRSLLSLGLGGDTSRQNMLAAGSRVLCPSWLWTRAGVISSPFTQVSAGWHCDTHLLKLS